MNFDQALYELNQGTILYGPKNSVVEMELVELEDTNGKKYYQTVMSITDRDSGEHVSGLDIFDLSFFDEWQSTGS